MAGKKANDPNRQNRVVQICLTDNEINILSAYANAKFDGKLSKAGRALIVSRLRTAMADAALSA